MNNHSLTRLFFMMAALLVAPLMLSACSDPQDAPVIAAEAPPPPLQVEMIPFVDNPRQQIWRSGYWVLSGNDFAWVPGKIIPRPSPTAVWAPARWVQHAYGWSFEQGHWE
jgi:hypothetical protein